MTLTFWPLFVFQSLSGIFTVFDSDYVCTFLRIQCNNFWQKQGQRWHQWPWPIDLCLFVFSAIECVDVNDRCADFDCTDTDIQMWLWNNCRSTCNLCSGSYIYTHTIIIYLVENGLSQRFISITWPYNMLCYFASMSFLFISPSWLCIIEYFPMTILLDYTNTSMVPIK